MSISYLERSAAAVTPMAFVIMLVCSSDIVAQAVSNEIRSKANEMYKRVFPRSMRMDKKAWDDLTADERNLLDVFLWEEFARSTTGESKMEMDGDIHTLQLALIGDDTARAMVAERYMHMRDPLFLEILNDPKLIPLIDGELFKNEAPVNFASDLIVLGAQESARLEILKVLSSSGAFGEDVRAWALDMQTPTKDYADPAGTEILRRWYRANEKALRAWDFSAVKPGENPEHPSTPSGDATVEGARRPFTPAWKFAPEQNDRRWKALLSLGVATVAIFAVVAARVFMSRRKRR